MLELSFSHCCQKLSPPHLFLEKAPGVEPLRAQWPRPGASTHGTRPRHFLGAGGQRGRPLPSVQTWDPCYHPGGARSTVHRALTAAGLSCACSSSPAQPQSLIPWHGAAAVGWGLQQWGGVPWAPTKSFHQRVVLGGSAGAGGSQHCPLPAPPLHIPAHCWPHSPSRQLNFGEKKIPHFHGNRRRKVSGAGAGMEPAGTRAAGPAAPQGWPHSPCSPPLPGPVGARPAASTSRGTAWASGSGGSSLPPRCVGRELTFRSAAQRVAMQREL